MFAGLCAKQQLQGGASRGFSEIAELLVLLFFLRDCKICNTGWVKNWIMYLWREL